MSGGWAGKSGATSRSQGLPKVAHADTIPCPAREHASHTLVNVLGEGDEVVTVCVDCKAPWAEIDAGARHGVKLGNES